MNVIGEEGGETVESESFYRSIFHKQNSDQFLLLKQEQIPNQSDIYLDTGDTFQFNKISLKWSIAFVIWKKCVSTKQSDWGENT